MWKPESSAGGARWGEERAARIALAALVGVVCLANVDWIHRNNLLQYHVDARWLVALVLNAADHIGAGGPGALREALSSLSLGGRPPLYAILALPFVLTLGPREDAALLVNVGFEAVLLAATFAAARRCGGPWAGWLAAFLVACYPPIVQLSRIFTPHFALPACVALVTWRLLVLLDARSVAAVWWLCATLAFGLMIHPSFVWTAAIPTSFVCLYVVFRDPRPGAAPTSLGSAMRGPLVLRGLVPGAAAVGLVLALWYVSGGARLLETLRSFDEIPVWAVRGFEGVPPGFAWYARTSPGALSAFFAGLLALATVRLAFSRDLRVRVLVLAFAGAYVLIQLQPARAWWYFSAALPLAACLSALFVVRLRGRLLSASLGALCAAVGAFNFATVSWGTVRASEPLARALGAPLDTETCSIPGHMVFCPNPPLRVDWKAAEILAAIEREGSCTPRPCRLLLAQPSLFPRSILTDHERWSDAAAGLSIHDGMGGREELARADLVIHVEPRAARYAVVPSTPWAEFVRQLESALGRQPRLLGTWRLPNESLARLVRIREAEDASR